MSELKRCPFCGGEAELKYSVLVGFEAKNLYFVRCMECHVKPFESFSKEEVIKAWNNRKPLERIVERLEEQAEECRKYWQEFDDEDSFGGMNAYCDAVKIVKEEGGLK